MKRRGNSFELSATDLVGYLNCRHLSELDRAVAEGDLEKPSQWDLLSQRLRQRGSAHERAYVEHLRNAGLEVVALDDAASTEKAVFETFEAMKRGAQVIVQGTLARDPWRDRADVLRRVAAPSDIGAWSYEAVETKLARETKAGTILQLCLYSDLLTEAQGAEPEHMHVVVPWSDFKAAGISVR